MGIVADLLPLAADVTRLKPLPGNPRVGDVAAVRASLERFGQRKPIVANEDGTVEAGNHTLLAALELGWTEVAVVWVRDDPTEAHAFALADNKSAEMGGYNDANLLAMMRDVLEADADAFAATGWTPEELDALDALIAADLDLGDMDDDDMTEEAGETLWPVIKAKVHPTVYAEWEGIPGDDDAARVVKVLELLEEAVARSD